MTHRVTWVPVVKGCLALMLDDCPVGIARYNWRKQLEARFEFNGQEYVYRGPEACRHARWALLSLVDVQQWVA